eukprot:scaffold26753_cov117-Cylindrotheca_fusiformis.AAC.1
MDWVCLDRSVANMRSLYERIPCRFGLNRIFIRLLVREGIRGARTGSTCEGRCDIVCNPTWPSVATVLDQNGEQRTR